MGSAISSLMVAAERRDRSAAEALFAALYSELHHLAKRELARRGVPVRVSTATLLYEAYLDMAARDGPSLPDRARFMGYAARVMRGLVIDHARERHAQKRGGLFDFTSLDTGVGRTQSSTANSSNSAKRWTSLSKWSQPSPRSLT